jgi:hypothetical protein
VVEFDPFDDGFHRDPYPTSRWLRDEVDEDAIEFLHSGNVQGPTSVPVVVSA